jgi:hypothetical protein
MRNKGMTPILSAGLLIGVLCAVWTFVMGFTGWYKDPARLNAFFLVIAIEIGGLIWGLSRTAAQGRGYGAQVVAGAMMSVIAGVVVVCSSLLFTLVAFPDYFREIEAAQRQVLQAQGRTPAEIEAAMQGNAAAATPMGQAMAGFIGTLLTGIVASAIIAIVLRSRTRPPTAGDARRV